jgi:hypothetical protein
VRTCQRTEVIAKVELPIGRQPLLPFLPSLLCSPPRLARLSRLEEGPGQQEGSGGVGREGGRKKEGRTGDTWSS